MSTTTTLTTDQRHHVTIVRKWQTRTDASTLNMARSLKALSLTMSSVREVSRVLAAQAVEGEDSIALSHVTIQRYINTLDASPADVTAPAFVQAYRDASKAAREAGKKPVTTGGTNEKDDAVTPGNTPGATVTTQVTNAETALQAFATLLGIVDSLPAKDRQRVITSMARTLARRYGKAA